MTKIESVVTYNPSLEWVESSEPGWRSRARAHVVAERRRRKSWEEEQSMAMLLSRRVRNRSNLAMSKSKQSTWDSMQEIVRPELLGAGRKDPFAKYPLAAPSDEELELLDYFYCVIVPKQLMHNGQDSRNGPLASIKSLAFSVASQDTAAFHFILSAVAGDVKRRGKMSIVTHEITHKIVALRLVNTRMADVALAISDENICAVAICAGVEFHYGYPENFILHMRGLEQMIKIRGGLETLRRRSPLLELFITWIDYAGAASLISTRWFPSLPVDPETLVYSPIAMRPPNIAIFNDAAERCDLYRDLVRTMNIVESVIKSCLHLCNATVGCRTCTTVGNLDRELYELFLLPEQSTIVGQRRLVQEIWRLAALVCISAASCLYLTHLSKGKDKFLQLLNRLHGIEIGGGIKIEALIFSLVSGQSVETAEVREQLRSLITMSVSMIWNTWKFVKLKLLYFLVQDEICQGPLQNVWKLRIKPIPSTVRAL
ncbi:hypothetical protein F5884DRAFT_810319 [Xylogone sp. PMI_703]|nr:hypothetical protein F5884DRAFT_810319 [Xylogone sp. PMI_703]